MNKWNAMTYEGKDTILGVVRNEATQFFALADSDETWEAPTGAGHWQVRDAVAHIVDTTEAYFVAFDSARANTEMPPAYGLPGMAARVDQQALALRSEPRAALMERLRTDFAKMMEIFDGLSEEDWTGLIVSHFYMGPLPAFFYPAFQLMDYGCTHGTSDRAPAERTDCPATRPTCSFRSCSSSGSTRQRAIAGGAMSVSE
jgi:hypothetical protein